MIKAKPIKLFYPLRLIYSLLTRTEKLFFDTFSFLKYRPKAKVISIGNLSMGGTGKTPILFELLSEMDPAKTCVISRGYKSPWENSFYLVHGKGPHPDELTDEATLLNRKFPDFPLLLGKRRYRSAQIAEKKFNPEFILLDDGFQYRRLYKDVKLVLWDAMSLVEEADLIPLGRLREPIGRLKDASAILLTRCESVSEERKKFWKNWLSQKASGIPIIEIQTVAAQIDQPNKADKKPYLAFAAIGRPESFFKQLKSEGLTIKDTRVFNDHHRFSTKELESLNNEAQKLDAQLICTEKDIVKIPKELIKKYNIASFGIRAVPVSGKSLINELKDRGILNI